MIKLKKVVFTLVSMITIYYAINYVILRFLPLTTWQAIRYDHTGYVRNYLNKGGDPNLAREIKWKHGWPEEKFTLLMEAARKGNLDIVSLLLENGANPNAETSFHRTALILAAEKGNLKMVELLVKNGADINHGYYSSGVGLRHGIDGVNALGEAIYYGHIDVVDFLINQGVEVTQGHLELAQWLLKHAENENSGVKKYEDIIALLLQAM